MANDAGSTVRVEIHRSDPTARGSFEVARFEPMMVLDALLAVQRQHEPALGFRFSCRVGMCGTCTVRVDGRPALACQTRIAREQAAIRLDPLAGFAVVRDLVVDTTPFFEEWARVMPYLVPDPSATEPARIPPDAAERRLIDPALDCIACGACYAGCGIAGRDRDFLGPAALNRAMVLIADSRDMTRAERLRAVTGGDGVWRCRYIHACTAACAKGLDPAGAIRRLRRWRLEGLDER